MPEFRLGVVGAVKGGGGSINSLYLWIEIHEFGCY